MIRGREREEAGAYSPEELEFFWSEEGDIAVFIASAYIIGGNKVWRYLY